MPSAKKTSGMRVVFFGTPEFAVPSLAALARRHEVALALTQPDRPKGRGRQVAEPPVKELARELGIPVLQPERLDEASLRPRFEAAGAEAAVVVAYGLKVPDWLLAFHPRGARQRPRLAAARVPRRIAGEPRDHGRGRRDRRDDDAPGLAHGRRADPHAAAHADRPGGDRGGAGRPPRRARRGTAGRDPRRTRLRDRAAAGAGRGARELRAQAPQGGRPDRLVPPRAGDRRTSCAASTPGRGRTRTSTAGR